MNDWKPVPFSFWLYSWVCASNESAVIDVFAQQRALARLVDTVPAPKTLFQRLLYKYITYKILAQMAFLARLLEAGMIAQGFIVFTEE